MSLLRRFILLIMWFTRTLSLVCGLKSIILQSSEWAMFKKIVENDIGNLCTGKQDTVYIYDTSDRSKQKSPVDVEISFFVTSEMTTNFFWLSYVN